MSICNRKPKRMNLSLTHKILTFSIAAVWIVNGLFCKVLNMIPRHELIVAQILGDEFSRIITVIIGLSETLIAIWFLSSYKTKLNAITQIVVVGTMNILEFILVPDLLLWGKLNSFFALVFMLLVYVNEFPLKRRLTQQI